MTELDLDGTSVTAPDGCPKDKFGVYRYCDAAACGRLLAWLNGPPAK